MGDGNSTPPDAGSFQESPFNNVPQILDTALYRSRGAAIVNIGPIEQSEITRRLPNYYHISVEDILKNPPQVSKEAQGIVVSGYSDKCMENEEQEKMIQAYIRSIAFNRDVNLGSFNVLVLSTSLPDIDYKKENLPWYNGPFQGDDSVWTLAQEESGMKLTRHDIQTEYIRDGKGRVVERHPHWIDKDSSFFKFRSPQ